MNTIWKYTLPVQDEVIVGIPEYSRPFHVDVQGDRLIDVWCFVDSEADKVRHDFRVIATGQEMPEGFRYIGTAKNDRLNLVWHVFHREQE